MELSLKEEFILLVYDDSKGRPVINGNGFLYSLAGAVLLELTYKQKISVRDKCVYVNNYKTSGDIVLDRIMEQIRKSPKNKKIKYWVQKIGFKGNRLKKAILTQMVDARVYRKEEYKIMGLINCYRYYNNKQEYKKELIQNIRRMVIDDYGIDERLMILASLCGTSGLVRLIFPDLKERRMAKKKIKEMVQNSDFGKAINETIAGANAAIIAAVGASTIVTTGSS